MLAGVGPLQFEVAVDRLEREFGATVGTDPAPWKAARRTDAEGAEVLRSTGRGDVLHGNDGSFLALFTSEYLLERFEREHPEVLLDRMLVR